MNDDRSAWAVFFMLDNCDRVCYNVKVIKKILRRTMNIKYGRKSI